MITSLRKWIAKAFNSSVIEKNRLKWVDYLRGIVIILVVYHHTFLGMVRNGIVVPKSVVDANMAAYSFRMPLFFIFSGIFTSLSLSSKSVRTIVWNKFNILFYPYVVWSVIQITLQLIFSHITKSENTYFDYLYILYQPKRLAHFWYLPALFNSTMIFVFIKSRFRIQTGYHLLLGLLFFMAAPFINSISMISNWMRFYIFLVIGDSLSFIILKKDIQEKLKNLKYFLALIPVFILAQLYYFNVIGVRSLENDSASFHINYAVYFFNEFSFLMVSLVGCATFISLSFQIEKWGRLKWLRIVGFHSLYIYIMHVIVTAFVRIALMSLFGISSSLVILILDIFFGVTVPIIFYNLIGKKYLWFLFSIDKNMQQRYASKDTVRSPELRVPPLPSTANR